MYNQICSSGVDVGPIFLYNEYNGLFFVVYFLFNNHILMNLFVGVIFTEFEST